MGLNASNKSRWLVAGTAVAAATVATAGLASSGSAAAKRSGGTIKIGVSLPLSGPLAGGGAAIEAGYKIAENAANAHGGLMVGGKKLKVDMLFSDNRSDPTTAANQTRDFVLQNHVVALLGSTTPAVVNPEGDVAQRAGVPLVTSLVGTTGFLAGDKAGWKYYWDLFPSEAGLATSAVDAAKALLPHDKRVGVLVTEDPDGQAQGPQYIRAAKAAGLNVVYTGTVPVGTTDFSSNVSALQSAKVQILLALFDPPDGAALFKQMHSDSFAPAFVVNQEAASLPNWLQVAGPAGEGALTLNFWSPGSKYANYGGHLKAFNQPTTGEGSAASYSAAEVLFSAIERAGGTSPAKINAALSKTDLTTPMGVIKFEKNHIDNTASVVAQWQGSAQIVVYPRNDKTAKPLQSPPSGLK